jgi:hypothetical protein
MATLRVNTNGVEPQKAAIVKAELNVGRPPDFKNKGVLVWNSLTPEQVQSLAVLMRQQGMRAEEIF